MRMLSGHTVLNFCPCIVMRALGTIPLRLKEHLRTIGVDTSIELIQRCALLGSARILRKVLEM